MVVFVVVDDFVLDVMVEVFGFVVLLLPLKEDGVLGSTRLRNTTEGSVSTVVVDVVVFVVVVVP